MAEARLRVEGGVFRARRRAAYVKGATLKALQYYVHCQFTQTIPVPVPKADRHRYRHRYLR
jgi:hypothetical protein